MNTINGKFLRTTPAIGIPKDDTKFVLQVIDDVLENVEKEDKVGCPPFVYTKIVAQVPFVRSIHNWLDFAIQLADEVECERFQFKKMKNDSYSSDINFSNYVSRQGICIIIMGHPNPCLYEIGNRLAKDIDSFHIDAITLVSNEIRKKTFIGKWIYSNIYAGKHVPFVIMNKLLVAELSIKKYRRQGYVLTGFPLIPTFLEPEFLPCSVYNTPCVVLPTAQDLDDPEHFNLVGDEDLFNTYLSFENEDTLSAFDEDDGYDGNSTSTDDSEGEDDLDENKWLLNEIKNFINESEFVYPTDYKCGKFVNESIANQLHFLNNLKLRPELIIYINNETEFTFAKRTKSEPEDEVEKQLEVYEHAFYTIQKYILKFDKDLVIVIDNRQDLDYTLTCIKNRFEYMNYKKFIQPNVIFPDGIPRRFQIVLDDLNQEKNLRIICNVNRILPELNWSPSQFMTRCPVKMYEGKIENGLEEFAVRYLRFTYFLSSEKAMDKFIKSPEKFFFIRPTCRVAIVGTNRVGKSVLTEVMRRLFKSEVYSTQSRVADLWAGNCDNKYIDSLKYAFKKAVGWANKQSRYYERLRNTKIKEWKHNISYILQSLIDGLFSEETLIKDAQPFMFFENLENLNEFLPKKWLKSNQLDPQINDGIVQMLFHEHIFETYTNSLADKTHISKDFIRWLRKIDNSKSLETNGDKNHAHWIIDNAPVNISFWEDIAHSHCLPDHVIFLKNSSLQKIFKSYGSKFNSRFVHFANIITSLCNENKQWFDINQFDLNDLFNTQHTSNKDKNVSLYAKFIAEMKLKQLPYIERDFSILQEFLTTNNIPFIVTDNKCFKSSILDSINKFLNFFEYPATNLKNTYFKGYNIEPYDRTFDYEIVKMELEDEEAFLDEDDMDDDSISNHGIDEDALDSDDEDVIADEYLKNFSSWNFGNTYDYCPVSFLDEGFLIRGNPSFGADYCNKVYCMRSAKERKLFLANPKKYSFLNSRPIPPAPRVFFLGPNNGYKCTMADFLANKMHVNLLSYQKLMQPFIKAANSINEDYSIDNFEKVYAEISADFIRNLVVNLKSNGGILVGYPLTLKQFQDIIENKMYPEAVITVADEWNDCFKAMFKHYARSYLIKSVYSQRVPVPDERFDYLCEYHKPASKVPAYLNIVDIAGLVKGAAEGQGLGNAFLSHISACDAIFHLCRAFEDPDVTHVEGEVDPVRDFEIISEELRLKDEEKLLVNLDKVEKLVQRGNDKKLKPEYDTLVKVKQILVEEKKHLRFADWSAHDIEVLNQNLFLTSKPVVYLVNLSEKDFIRKKNKWLIKIKEWVDCNDPGAIVIPFSCLFESKLSEMNDDERNAYEDETKCKGVLNKIIVTGYKALQLEYFFTAGPDEVRAWTIQKGTKAPQAAGRIHTDFEKGFIMAEVMHYKDFKEEGSETAAKAAGKYRQQGRNYVVEDGDIIFFKFNAGAGLKDAKKK